jgi:hypothetical protein
MRQKSGPERQKLPGLGVDCVFANRPPTRGFCRRPRPTRMSKNAWLGQEDSNPAWRIRCLLPLVVQNRQAYVPIAKKGLAFCSEKSVCAQTPGRLRSADRRTLSPCDRADPGLASVRGPGLAWPPMKDAKDSPMSIKLTDTQLVILSAAAQREDRYNRDTPARGRVTGRSSRPLT